MNTESKDDRTSESDSTGEYVRQIRSAIDLDVPKDQWLKIIEDKGASPDLISELSLLWEIASEPPRS